MNLDNPTLWYVLGGSALVFVALVIYVIRSRRVPKAEKAPEPPQGEGVPAEVAAEAAPEIKAVEEAEPESELAAPPADLSSRLTRTRSALLGGLTKFFSGKAASDLGAGEWEEIEEALLEGDVGMRTIGVLLEKVKARAGNGASLRDLILEEGENLLSGLDHGLPDLDRVEKPYVISIVGVNGVGKTTSIGKIAHRYTTENRQVLMGAADTFRAAAVSQLKVWADRVGAQFVSGREGGDPGAVAFDAVSAGKARGMDVVLLDTAGRLHTKTNLMEELKKVHRVMKKVIPEAPHETWLVVDGTLGQNSLQQAKQFHSALELTGIIVTKLDGTAKGGAVLAIASELKLPIRFIGVGESMEDLVPFEPKPFVEAILGG